MLSLTFEPWWLGLLSVAMRGGGGSANKGLLSEAELKRIEVEHAEGVTAPQVVDIFVSRSVKFSEATLRKYVQLRLLPRSKRVGRKGKHRGSLGIYPVRVVRRVNEVKRHMADGFTIEEIQENFFRYADTVDEVRDAVKSFFSEVAPMTEAAKGREQKRFELACEQAQETAAQLIEQLEKITKLTSKIQEDAFQGAGAAGSAEDLL